MGTRLDAITSLAYSTYRTSGTSALAPSLQFDIDTNMTDANTAWQGRLVYEPYLTHTVSTGVWQTWNPEDNAGTGNWWFSGAPGNALCPLNNPCTWSELLADFPNAGIRSAGANTGALQFKAGGGWTSGFVGSVDAFSIGVGGVVTTYDFELPFTVPTTVSISPSAKLTTDSAFTLTVNGTNFFPSSVVTWNGLARTTTFVSNTQLTAAIPSTDLATASTFPVTVVTGAPGGGTSNTQTFTINPPAPPPSAPLTVTVSVGNGHGGTAVASDFHLSVYINDVLHAYTAPTQIPVGASFTVNESLPDGYSRSFGTNCSGVVLDTSPLSCTITNQDNALSENTAQLCADGIDNNSNTLVDLADPSCISFIPHDTLVVNVVNDTNGSKQPSDFTVHVKNANVDVAGSPSFGALLPGTAYVLPLGTYVVSESVDAAYVQSFAGDCDVNGNVTLTAGIDKACTILNTSIPPPAPPAAPALPNTGGGGGGSAGGYTLLNVSFSGQAYPGSNITVLEKLPGALSYDVVLPTTASILPDGKFQLTINNLLVEGYLFAIQATDANGRTSRILPLTLPTAAGGQNVSVDNILIPPTIELASAAISPGQPLSISGYAAPLSTVDVWIDNTEKGETVSSASGSYQFTTTATDLPLALHSVKAQFVFQSDTTSEFSTEKVFKVEALAFPKTDLNFDGVVDVSDWSIFLFRWGGADVTLKPSIDFNNDGQVDVTDFSIFLDAMGG